MRRLVPAGATAFEVATLGTVEFLPFVLFTLPAGVRIDRMRRRSILVAGDLGRAVLLTSIPLAYALGDLTLAQLYIVGFLSSGAQLAGPGVAGGLIALVTAPYAILVDAISFVVSGGFTV